MSSLHEKSILGAVEYLEFLGEHNEAKAIGIEYSGKIKQSHKKEGLMIEKNKVFEGTLVAAGWDDKDNVNLSSLYTQDDEDILLVHGTGMKKFSPYLNQHVKVWGDIISTKEDGRKFSVKKIRRLLRGFQKPYILGSDEFNGFAQEQ